MEELPTAIRTSLKKHVNPANMKELIDYIDKQSFQVDRHTAGSEIRRRFSHKKIQEQEMISFLEDFNKELEIFSSEYIKKIKHIKLQVKHKRL